MSFRELVLKTRSFRRFHQEEPISLDTLRELIDLARQTASGSNIQPLKYILVADPEIGNRVFPHTRWAGYCLLRCEGWSPTTATLFVA